MRVVIVSHGYGTDERMRLLETIGEDIDVTVIAPVSVETQVFGKLSAPTSDRVRVIANRTRRFGGRGHFVFRPSWRAYWKLRPSVLHMEYDPWTPEFWSIALPIVIVHPRTPIVLYVKKNTRHVPGGIKGLVERALTRIAMLRVKRIVAVSQKAASVFVDLGYGDTPREIQAQLPIDGDVFAPPEQVQPPHPFTVGFVGSIAPHKGIHSLIEAVRQTRERLDAEVRLSLIGPMCDDEIDQLVAGIPWIDQPGSLPNRELPAVLATFDVFVMPSLILPDHEEHDAHSLLEAMAVGVACIGSRSGIMPEIIRDGENGWLFPPGDTDSLTDLLEKLAADPAARQHAGQAARTTALEFAGLDRLVERRSATYKAVESHV